MDMIQKAVQQMAQRQHAQGADNATAAGGTTAERPRRLPLAQGDPRQVDPLSAAGKQFRVVARRLLDRWSDGPQTQGRIVMVTSTEAGEGSSFVALNLARAFAGTHETSVALVDTDPAVGGLTHGMRMAQAQGWTDVLAAGAPLDAAMAATELPRLWFMAAGRPSASVQGLPDLGPVLDQLKARFQIVVCDTPPLLAQNGAVAVALAEHADAVLVVAAAGRTDPARLRAAAAMIQTGGSVECILNREIQALSGLDPLTLAR